MACHETFEIGIVDAPEIKSPFRAHRNRPRIGRLHLARQSVTRIGAAARSLCTASGSLEGNVHGSPVWTLQDLGRCWRCCAAKSAKASTKNQKTATTGAIRLGGWMWSSRRSPPVPLIDQRGGPDRVRPEVCEQETLRSRHESPSSDPGAHRLGGGRVERSRATKPAPVAVQVIVRRRKRADPRAQTSSRQHR